MKHVIAVLLAMSAALVIDIMVDTTPPAQMAVFAFVATYLLVFFSKLVMSPLVQRPVGSRAGDPVEPLPAEGGDHG